MALLFNHHTSTRKRFHELYTHTVVLDLKILFINLPVQYSGQWRTQIVIVMPTFNCFNVKLVVFDYWVNAIFQNFTVFIIFLSPSLGYCTNNVSRLDQPMSYNGAHLIRGASLL